MMESVRVSVVVLLVFCLTEAVRFNPKERLVLKLAERLLEDDTGADGDDGEYEYYYYYDEGATDDSVVWENLEPEEGPVNPWNPGNEPVEGTDTAPAATAAVNLDGGKTDLKTCGLANPVKTRKRRLLDLLERIVGGSETSRGQYPWMVAIGSPDPSNPSGIAQMCGATLISKEWVLTAAHCFTREDENGKMQWQKELKDWVIRVGEHNLNVKNPDQSDQTPGKIIVHQAYKLDGFANDVALMKLRTPIERFGNYINIPCVSDTPTPVANSDCYVTGWGATAEGSFAEQTTLLKVKLPLLAQSHCGLTDANKGRICAGHLPGGKDSCQGDSGGPLVCVRDGRFYLTGVVSYGEGCARKDKPGVYANVAHYVPWIKEVISKM